MPQSRSTSSYPAQYFELFRRLNANPVEVSIPSDNPQQLRFSFYGFFRALEAEGLTEFRRQCGQFILRLEPGAVTISPRTNPSLDAIIASLPEPQEFTIEDFQEVDPVPSSSLEDTIRGLGYLTPQRE